MTARAFITGVSGFTLTANERAFLREAEPWGFILFGRNIRTPAQVTKLVAECREVVGTHAPVLIDQEGGRVQRLGHPHWPYYPSGSIYGRIYDRDVAKGLAAAGLGARLIASDLMALGIDVDCLPIADVPARGANAVIGDRAYGRTPEAVAAIGGAVAAGLLAGGVLPVLKHIPGHGRARADSHERLPVVKASREELEPRDFAAFQPLSKLPMGMTAHVVFSDIDPLAPATTSATMVREVIRGFIGFQGLLMSDDIAMGALSGTPAERTQAALAAGCDVVLHCNGKLAEMRAVAAHAPKLAGKALKRANAALAMRARAGGVRSRRGPQDLRRADRRRSAGDGPPRCAPPGPQDAGPRRAAARTQRTQEAVVTEDAAFEAEFKERAPDEPALVVDVEGFEGPLDLLLMLARQQKVDLAKISILALADQYLAFIEEARRLRLELAADYLVMAAWLAYLKSRLLLPETAAPEGMSAEDMANALALRLKRLEAIRDAAQKLFERPQLDRDVFVRGQPEPIAHIRHPQWTATLYDLLTAYASQRQKTALSHVRMAKRAVWSLAEAREALERLVGAATRLDTHRRLPDCLYGRAVAARDRAGVELCLRARAGARGRGGNPPAGGVRAALHAQA